MRGRNWAATPLGPGAAWLQSLRSLAELMLATPQPALLAWGPALTILYNDACRPIFGARHRDALGMPLAALLAEAGADSGPLLEAAMRGEAQRAPVPSPTGPRLFAWVPVRDEGGAVAGLYATEVAATVPTVESAEGSGARFRALASASSDAVYRMSADWREMRHLRGQDFIADTEDPSRTWLDRYIHPDDQPMVVAAIEEAVRTKGIFALEHRVRRLDGSLGWTFSRAAPMLDEAGRITEWFGTASDITERKRAEEALRQSQAEAGRQRRLYEAILTNTPDLAYIFDLDQRFIYANEGLLRMWGRSWEEAIGKTCLELGYPDWHAAMHGREIEQVVATRKPIRGQVPFTGTFGRRIYDYIFVPVLGADGRVEAVAGTTRDVTEQTETEAALRDSQARLSEALSAARMAAWRWDPVTDRSSFTGMEAEVFGLLPGTTLESSAEGQSLLHPEDVERHRALVREATRHGTAWHSEFRIIRPRDGRIAWLEERASAERDPDTGAVRMTGLVWDITERKEAEERQKLLSREVDHRAKNALAVVQSALRLTRAEDLPSYVRAVTGRVSALARAQTLLAEDRWHGADLRTLLEGELAPFIDADQRVILEGPRLAVPAPAAQPLAMAVHELATNAVKYGALSVPMGRLAVTWRVEGGLQGWLRLRWAEMGGPPVAAPPERRGFGSRVLEGTMRGQLGGTVTLNWQPAGLGCEMEIPLSRNAAD
ncbi:PAS domain-containing protein [Belnapia sp. T6]|uniref:histidine kinase n=1 Tax=Belnapia mucosa TaxID=2804532 RepID=A0ABS1V7V1_9PROT|nr:PAS domain S-box protein [Belnapia mucosa]MBL6457236.1 PAS domain-containing protein [Belnapia mucosa]